MYMRIRLLILHTSDVRTKQNVNNLNNVLVLTEVLHLYIFIPLGSFQQAARGNAGATVLGDPSKWSRPKKTLILYEYEGSAYW